MYRKFKHIVSSIPQFIHILFFILLITTGSFANDGEGPASQKGTSSSQSINFSFRLVNSGRVMIDSALIILDKYDLTGAGIVMERVKLDENNCLILSGVPEGKYYAGIYTYGLQREYLSVVITVKKHGRKKSTNTVRIKVADTDLYVPGQAEIPAEDPSKFQFAKM